MIFDLAKLPEVSAERPVVYDEAIRTAEFRGGYYVLRAGAEDPQSPHTEDEVYFVIRGRATFEMDGRRQAVRAGHVLVVPAWMEHRFVEVEEDLALFVVFAGPKKSARPQAR